MSQLEFTTLLEEAQAKAPEPTQIQDMLPLDDYQPFCFYTTTSSPIFTFTPSPDVRFGDGEKEIGRFSWPNGVFRFEGEAEESAKIFANYIAGFLGMKLPS